MAHCCCSSSGCCASKGLDFKNKHSSRRLDCSSRRGRDCPPQLCHMSQKTGKLGPLGCLLLGCFFFCCANTVVAVLVWCRFWTPPPCKFTTSLQGSGRGGQQEILRKSFLATAVCGGSSALLDARSAVQRVTRSCCSKHGLGAATADRVYLHFSRRSDDNV